MSWAEDRAEAEENYVEARVDAKRDHLYYDGRDDFVAGDGDPKEAAEMLRKLRDAHG